jgi:putative transcriptional regulator
MGRPALTAIDGGWSHADGECRQPFHYTGCGLDDVYLLSGYEIEETPYGRGVRISYLDKLHETIGLYLVKDRKFLKGREWRFLRHHMDVTQSELARLIGCDAQQIARYEKNECNIPGPADRMIRVLYEDHAGKRLDVRKFLDRLDGMDDVIARKLLFAETNGEWKRTAA